MRIGRVLKSATGQQTIILQAARTNLSRCCDARSTSRLGQERRFERASATSGLPPEADIRLRCTK
jgi:hypothetical protein